MPSTKKKSPSEAKKKLLVSTKAKTSIKKNTKKSKPVDVNDGSYLQGQEAMAHSSTHKFRFICCFTARSTARIILRWVVYRWRKPVHTAL